MVTANGDFDLAFGGQNASDSIVRITLNGSALIVADYFAPFNQHTLATTDNDLGSSGLLLIPGTRLGTAAGKNGSLYLVNLDNLDISILSTIARSCSTCRARSARLSLTTTSAPQLTSTETSTT